tara:strand:- start:13113 stop:13787 length:675 start_codon:yes stop_codon:yes gene_type:complete
MGKIILNSKNLTKSYQNGDRRLVVLNRINLKLEAGTITTIIGESGSGKSTLLNVLSSLDTFDSGKLLIENEDIKSFNEKKISSFRNEKIGFIFQFHHLLPDFTVMDNVLMPLWIKKGFGQYERPLDLLSDFGLLKIKDKYPDEVSGGERQRVAIIRSIVNKPKILFADEPSGNLDEKNSAKLIDLFKRINRDFNMTIMLTTHNPSIAKIGNNLYELKSGELIKR